MNLVVSFNVSFLVKRYFVVHQIVAECLQSDYNVVVCIKKHCAVIVDPHVFRGDLKTTPSIGERRRHSCLVIC